MVAAVLTVLAVGVARADERVLTAAWRTVATPAGASGRSELALDVSVDSGWHVNAHDPDSPYLIPTELQVDAPPGGTVADVRYPDPVTRKLAFAGGRALRLYEGRFAIGVLVDGPPVRELSARLRYQACSDERCLPPRTLPVRLVAGPVGDARADDHRAATTDAAGNADGAGGFSFDAWFRERGLLATLAVAMVFGLGLNLTPCVYPLISVTIAYFGGQSAASPARVTLLACAYVFGIAITFSALGVTAALSGGLFGAALQQPAVLLGVALVLVALAASNFGVYQLQMPTALVQRAGKASRGLAGAVLMGLTMGIVAAPCVGPIVVALLLFVAAHHDATLGFALFFALALGMGAPYVGLAAAAGSIRRLPRSGDWLAWVEHLFGFVLLGMALYFAEPVLGARVVAVATPLLMAVAGLYLGFFDVAGRTLAGFLVVRRVVGVAALLAAVWVAVPRGDGAITWQPFSPAALEAAARDGRPAAIDFTATWCLPCRENDHVTFRDPRVAAAAERWVMLRADVSESNEETERWMAKFAVVGVPTIVLYDTRGAEAARTVGFVEPEKLLALMIKGQG